MSKIDLLKLKNRVDNHQPFYFVTQPAYLPRTVSIAVAILLLPFVAHYPHPYVLSFLYSIKQILTLKQRYQWHKASGKSLTYQIINEKVMQTAEYQECIELYDDYIKKVAEFLHIFNFTSSKELLMFMQHCMTMGAFSKSFSHQYRQYKNNYEYVNDLLGATTLTGTSVCRHMASLFNDILNAYGETSCFLVVRTQFAQDISDVIENTAAKFEHAVIGVKSHDKKYIYDPTDALFASSTNETNNPHQNATIAQSIIYSPEKKYYIQGPIQLALKEANRESTIEIANLPFTKISPEEIKYYYDRATAKFINNTSITYDFHTENQSQVMRIAELISQISPVTDEEITTWQLTKLPKQHKKH